MKSPSIQPSLTYPRGTATSCFSINPVYRGETRQAYSLVLNTILNLTASTPAASWPVKLLTGPLADL